ncbi:MAG: AraC family transcriptional regulator [Pseudomonadota bacterium]
MDVLSDILDLVRLQGSLYFRTAFNAPWGVKVPAYKNVARFHLVARGQCWITVDGQEPTIALSTGDLILIPHGSGHTLRDAPDTPAETVERVLEETCYPGEGVLVYGGPDLGNATSLICGHFAFDEAAGHPLLDALPPFIHVKGTESLNVVWLENAMRFMGHEAGTGRIGSEAIVLRLTEIIFIQVIRTYAEGAGAEQRIISGIADPQIGRALAAVHRSPESPWTLENLAREAGLSRTSFVLRFNELMGMTALQYLTRWRTQKARKLLIEDTIPPAEVAARVGYQSEAAFARVFKKHYGVGPATYRRQRAAR